jgi:hypothetical protein
MKTILITLHASAMSDESEEVSGDTSKRLLDDFSGADEVEDTDRERKKSSIRPATLPMGLKTGGLGDTPWSKETSVHM